MSREMRYCFLQLEDQKIEELLEVKESLILRRLNLDANELGL